MSTLLECVELVEETRDNSKQALIDKGVELDDSYKLSEVDEKIAEIQSGGSSLSEFRYLEYARLKYSESSHGPLHNENPTYFQGYGHRFTVEVKAKEDCNIYLPNDTTFNCDKTTLKVGETASIEYYETRYEFKAICFGENESYQEVFLPDVLIFADHYDG